MEPYGLVRINCPQRAEPELSAAPLAGDLTGILLGWSSYGSVIVPDSRNDHVRHLAESILRALPSLTQSQATLEFYPGKFLVPFR